MRPWERRAFNTCAALVTVSGVAFGWMKYFAQPLDPFAVVNSPWQPAMLALHLLTSPPFLLLFGIVFNSHVMRKLKGPVRGNRKTGYVSLATFVTMVLSGYLLQVLTNEALLQAALVAHLTSSGIFAVTYAAHLLIAALMKRPVRGRVQEAV